jgi:hypothetical protein
MGVAIPRKVGKHSVYILALCVSRVGKVTEMPVRMILYNELTGR